MKRVYAAIWPHRRAKKFEGKTKIYGETESGRSLRLYRKHNSIHLSYPQSSVHCHIRSLCWWLELLLLLLLFRLLLLTVSRCCLLYVQRAHVWFIQMNRNNWRLSLFLTLALLSFLRSMYDRSVVVNSHCHTSHTTSLRACAHQHTYLDMCRTLWYKSIKHTEKQQHKRQKKKQRYV